MNKKIFKNSIMYAIKAILSVVFPLITFPYISRILQVESIGRYNFANSVTSYFLLFAGFGISTFAVREGARYRDNKKEMSVFASEIFTVNMLITIFAYILLLIVVSLVPRFWDVKGLICIFSITIFFTTLGTEWIYNIYEEYTYITMRKFIFQIISVILLFMFVKSKEDCYIYAGVTVFSNVGSEIINYLFAKRLCKVHLVFHFKYVNWHNFIRPLCLVFLSSLATSVFVNSDITLLGLFNSEYDVGVYSVAVKVYNIIKALISSIIIVSLSRLSYYFGNDLSSLYDKLFSDVLKTISIIVFPCIIGTICLSPQIIRLISDKAYIEAVFPLELLSVSLFFCMYGWIYNQGSLIIRKYDHIALLSTINSAIINITLNIILMPRWNIVAAAITTIIAEASNMLVCIVYLKKQSIKTYFPIKEILKSFISSIPIFFICKIICLYISNDVVQVMLTIVISIPVYFLMQILLKNKFIIDFLMSLNDKYKERRST